jgi:hypothetical protein
MKKVILSLVFVLATGMSFMNANVINGKEKDLQVQDCHDVYNRTRDFVYGMTGSLHIGITAAIAAEEACLNEEEELTMFID